ncbi:MAG: hypothetical protein HQK60_05170 [Deltaproteobacteria bacterium]|nr:hypothetical protein [Deltaproteobacteria bacterium]
MPIHLGLLLVIPLADHLSTGPTILPGIYLADPLSIQMAIHQAILLAYRSPDFPERYPG